MAEHKSMMHGSWKEAIRQACKAGSLKAIGELADHRFGDLERDEMLRLVCESGRSCEHILDWLLKTFTFTSYERQFALRGCCYNGDMEVTQFAVAQLKPTQDEIYTGRYTPFEQACGSNLAIARWLAMRFPPTISNIRNDNDRHLVNLARDGMLDGMKMVCKLDAMKMVCSLVPLPADALYKPFKAACDHSKVKMVEWILETYHLPIYIVKDAAQLGNSEMQAFIGHYCAQELAKSSEAAKPSEVANLKTRITDLEQYIKTLEQRLKALEGSR